MCPPCTRAARKPGRHRAHYCERGGVTGSIGYTCDCPCNQPSSRFNPPSMALDDFNYTTEDLTPRHPDPRKRR